jgi:predicted nucleic acid-binding protein
MILVDSSVWIDYFNGTLTTQTDFLDKILGKELIIVGDIILLEVLQGFRSDRDYTIALNSLKVFPFRNMLGKEIALKSAQNYRYLKKRGIMVRKMIDIIIATFCIENNLELLYSDKDFGPLVDQLSLKNALS